jgi:acyl-coenzyme A synthetase/AMP-(fatty) acid ligase
VLAAKALWFGLFCSTIQTTVVYVGWMAFQTTVVYVGWMAFQTTVVYVGWMAYNFPSS